MATLPPPRDLTIPEPGSTTARSVLSRAMNELLRELSTAPRRSPPGARDEAAALARISRAALQASPGPLASALRRPTVGGLLRCLRGAGPEQEGVFVELTGQLAFELAVAGALPGPVRLRRAPARLLSIPARLGLALAPGATGLVLDNGLAIVERDGAAVRVDLASPAPGAGVTVERPYLPIRGDVVLALADNNPLAQLEAHPDKAGNAVDLGGHASSAWIAALDAALARIERHLPELYGEMQLFIAQIVPVGWDEVKHLSASYQEILGTIYMTLHPSQMTLSEALIHEFSHNKLNALFELDDVLENAWSPLYSSPVRPDPRPLHGVLLAVHAFLPVARLYERMLEVGDPEARSAAFAQRFARIREINREGAALVLEKGEPTAVGKGLFDEIRRWDEHYAKLALV